MTKKIIIISLIILFAVSVYLAIDVSTEGDVLSKLEKRESFLATENRELTQKLVRQSSLTSLISEAENRGFLEPEEIIYLGHQEFAARIITSE